tara:strand:+ start:803 stop:1183 length:381 start_codon:yes stop_codon:yes gene_type:complete
MPTRKAINKGARARGSRAEAMLHKSLTESGYEVRRTHLSAFPDIIAWNKSKLLMVEVKSRTAANPVEERAAIRNAVRLFSNSAKELNFVHNGSEVLCYLQINDTWLAYKWNGVGTVPVKSVIKEER